VIVWSTGTQFCTDESGQYPDETIPVGGLEMVDQLIAIDDELISDADLAELESVEVLELLIDEALEVSAYV